MPDTQKADRRWTITGRMQGPPRNEHSALDIAGPSLPANKSLILQPVEECEERIEALAVEHQAALEEASDKQLVAERAVKLLREQLHEERKLRVDEEECREGTEDELRQVEAQRDEALKKRDEYRRGQGFALDEKEQVDSELCSLKAGLLAWLRGKSEEEKAIADACPLGSMGALAERARSQAFGEAANRLEALTLTEQEEADETPRFVTVPGTGPSLMAHRQETKCERCHGRGTICTGDPRGGSFATWTCPRCNGTGKAPQEPEEAKRRPDIQAPNWFQDTWKGNQP